MAAVLLPGRLVRFTARGGFITMCAWLPSVLSMMEACN